MSKNNKKSFRLDDNSLSSLTKLGYDTESLSMEHVMDGYFALRTAALRELRGMFNREELIALVDMQNGHLLTPQYQTNLDLYLQGVRDSELMNDGVSRHGADYGLLMVKLNILTTLQLYFLQEEIDRFWNTTAYGERYSPNLESFLDAFAPEKPKNGTGLTGKPHKVNG